MRKDWMIDELAHAGPEHLDPAFVAGYDEKQGRPDPSDDIDRFFAHGLGPAATIIDLGAGTGQFALAAARVFGQIIAVDVSPAMVEALRARAAAAELTNLRVERAGFLSYEHAGPPADGVYTRNALHHLPDFWKGVALDRIARMIQAGGILRIRDMVYDFQPAHAEETLERWLSQGGDDPAVEYTAADLAEHVRSEYSTYRWLFEPLLAAAGFDVLTAEYRGSIYAAYSCRKR
jgi:ubiquinone/menaquinone biosynthesis C-methylase UbiE